jgi:hypothetical protein
MCAAGASKPGVKQVMQANALHPTHQEFMDSLLLA